MLYANIRGATHMGIEGYLVTVEVDIARGIPSFEIVGLPTASVREAKERVRAAITNSGFVFPMQRIVVNLAPADRKKDGSGLDLPIALGILCASGQLKKSLLDNTVCIGELSLQGGLMPVRGVLAMALGAKAEGIAKLCLPVANYAEGALSGLETIQGLETLADVVAYLRTGHVPQATAERIEREKYGNNLQDREESIRKDMWDVHGQMLAKRVLEIAAAGGHNVCMIGPPGAGKTMLAQRLLSILPPLTPEESVEVTKIYSIAGLLQDAKPCIERPFRSPHHTITATGMVGGGGIPRPGEVTLSHKGVLFLDELPEFSRDVLEVLRQPLEDGVVHISRLHGNYTYPAQMSLVVAMNPCPCGYRGDAEHICVCTDGDLQRYKRKISGPLLDRFDLFVHVQRPSFAELRTLPQGESSSVIRERVMVARNRQQTRYQESPGTLNAHLTHRQVQRYCALDSRCEQTLQQAYQQLQLSARSLDRILKVARTIADMGGEEMITLPSLLEALQYRIPF